jgi:predicted DNA-binding transcriptional regulator AlpA
MTDGTLPSLIAPDDHGVPHRWSRLSDVWSYRDLQDSKIRFPDLAEKLGIRYDELYRMMRHLGLALEQHPTSREFTLTEEEADTLRAEHQRVRALHLRSMKLPAAARQLKLTFSTVRLLAIGGGLDLESETDTSGARFVTRTSVEACWLARNEAKRRRTLRADTVPFAEVMRFTGLGRRAVVDLVRAGVLVELPNRRTCDITTSSLEAWLVNRKNDPNLTGG